MKIRDLFGNLLFPPFCDACETSLGLYSTEALCPDCLRSFENERNYICPLCRQKQRDCECLPAVLKPYSSRGIHLAEYTKEPSITRSLILFAKDHNECYLFRFLGERMAQAVEHRLDPSGMLVCYVPRSRKKAAKVGVDPSKETAKEMARRLTLPCVSLLFHRGSQVQKELSASGRRKNAAASYGLIEKKRPMIAGKRILLLDDVITTGATMAACARLLRHAGAAEVIPVSVGMTYERNRVRQRDAVHKSYHTKKRNLPF